MVIGRVFYILLSILTLRLVEADFDFKLKYCRFKCSDKCKDQKEPSNPNGRAQKIEGYYWRDFFGEIPPDAYPLGPISQDPQTYIGMVFDASKNGTFITTIIKDLDYVYTILNGAVTKKNKHIQILCTMDPGRMIWITLTTTNSASVQPGDIYVIAGRHDEISNRTKISTKVTHFIGKTSKCKVSYVGTAQKINMPMEYVLMDGTPDTSKEFLWLLYRPNGKMGSDKVEGKNKAQPFFSHHYEYNINPNSIIPKFYKQINLGSCSIICTNQDKGKPKYEQKMSLPMAYYWKPQKIWDVKEALLSGEEYGHTVYTGQTYTVLNSYDIGQTYRDGKSLLYRINGNANYAESGYFQILCSNHQEKLEWVNATTDTFDSLDQSLMVPAGEMDNGTQIFVGKQTDTRTSNPASIRLLKEGATATIVYGTYNYFQVLMYKKDEKKQ